MSVAVPIDQHPESPAVQVQVSGTVALSDRWDAGPVFLLGIADHGEPGPFSAGVFVRLWAPGEEVRAALRAEAGWGWVGLGADIAIPASEEVFITSSPGFFLTPEAVGARAPLGVTGRWRALDLSAEAGLITTLRLDRRIQGAPYVGSRIQVHF